MRTIAVKTAVKTFVLIVIVAAVGAMIVLAYLIGGGVSARPQPGQGRDVRRTDGARHAAIVWHAPDQQNPHRTATK